MRTHVLFAFDFAALATNLLAFGRARLFVCLFVLRGLLEPPCLGTSLQVSPRNYFRREVAQVQSS